MPFVKQRIISWLKPKIESRPTLNDSPCQECSDLLDLSKEILQNFSLLAETGYAEGVICHTLAKESGELNDKQNVAIGTPLVVRPRKLLKNVLINHDGLDVLFNIIIKGLCDANEPFADAVYSLSNLSAHIGIVAPFLKISEERRSPKCCYNDKQKSIKNDLKMKTDDGQIIEVNKQILTDASGFFEAMLLGQFVESNQREVKIPMTGFQALTCLVHYLYGCRWCSSMQKVEPKVLLELTSLTDQYLLSDFNQSVSLEILKRCSKVSDVVEIYEASLVEEYPLKGTDSNLNACATSFILVGDIGNCERTEIFDRLVKSKMANDFMEDINRAVREKLLSR